MKCPYCKQDTKVVDKREAGEPEVTRRRRECLKCQRRFTTYERVEEIDLMVVKKDGSRERFDRKKLITGVMHACEKRPVPVEKIEGIADSIEVELRKRDVKEVPSKKIGEMVIRRLRSLDKVAYIRFASVYREFEDVEKFEEEVKKLIKH